MTQHSSGTSDSLGLFTPAVMSVHVSKKKKKIFTECVTGPEAARGPHRGAGPGGSLQGFLKQEQHRFTSQQRHQLGAGSSKSTLQAKPSVPERNHRAGVDHAPEPRCFLDHLCRSLDSIRE